jgi:succinate dehydrogenase / fumarate reductase flavoprotein subunit
MYQEITADNAYQTPMRIYPALHYTMGGLWVDYNLMSTIPGLFVLGEANFSDHGANRLGASALMQGLADGYFIIPYTIGDYLASTTFKPVSVEDPAFKDAERELEATVKKLMAIPGKRAVDDIHRQLGQLLWEKCGMARNAAALQQALAEISKLRDEFWHNIRIPGANHDLNQELEKAQRVADFLELAELLAQDALHRQESCGGHFREEYQTAENEALRDDEHFSYAAAWEFRGVGMPSMLHKEPLTFEYAKPSQRSYK